MVNFVVKGPYIQGCRRERRTRKSSPACWRLLPRLPHVGKATTNILKEAFNPRNLNNLAEYINSRRRGKLQLYIVYQERVHGEANKGAIAEIEEFIIGHAARRNPNLINIHGTGPSDWSISGLANNGRGNPGQSVQQFKQMLGIVTKRRVDGRPPIDANTIEPSNSESASASTDAESSIRGHWGPDQHLRVGCHSGDLSFASGARPG